MKTESFFMSLSHSKWDCKYHVVFVPKHRKKKLYGSVRRFLGSLFHELAPHRSCKILEGHMVQDHVHMIIGISPKYSIAEVIGYLKGKSAIAVCMAIWWSQKKFYRREVLGKRLCCFDSRF